MEGNMNMLKSTAVAAFAFCSMALTYAAPTHAADRHVRLYNDTPRTIVRFHASNIGTNSWQEDILGADVLDPGDSALINLDDGTGYCVFDFKTVFDNGTSLVRRRVNVCTTGSYTVSARW
jgi:hypothetical protein